MAIFTDDMDEDLIEDYKEHFGIMTSSVSLLLGQIKYADTLELKEILNELFRIFHNVKSSSMYFELDDIAVVCHKTEDLIQQIINQGYKYNSSHLIWLSFVQKQFEIWLCDMIEDNDNLSPLNNKLTNLQTFNELGNS